MSARTVRLIDSSQKVLATAQVDETGGTYGGTIDLANTPACVQSLFEEFEEIVNGQMFSFLDEAQGKIASLGIKVVFEDGGEALVKDLQVYPSTGEVSFKLADRSVACLRSL